MSTDFYDWTYLMINAVQRHHIHFLRIVVDDDHVIHRCHSRGRPTVHFPVNQAIVSLVHHNLLLEGQHIEVIADQIQA